MCDVERQGKDERLNGCPAQTAVSGLPATLSNGAQMRDDWEKEGAAPQWPAN